VHSLSLQKNIVTVDHPAERALVFELMQMGDVINSVLTDLLPNRLCDYLKEISVKFTDFVTKCHVLNVEEHLMNSRLLICLATKMMMKKCFDLLGIDTLERI
jgi:arginyl-tRNA synthetase